jgi:hypothetical protein
MLERLEWIVVRAVLAGAEGFVGGAERHPRAARRHPPRRRSVVLGDEVKGEGKRRIHARRCGVATGALRGPRTKRFFVDSLQASRTVVRRRRSALIWRHP